MGNTRNYKILVETEKNILIKDKNFKMYLEFNDITEVRSFFKMVGSPKLNIIYNTPEYGNIILRKFKFKEPN